MVNLLPDQSKKEAERPRKKNEPVEIKLIRPNVGKFPQPEIKKDPVEHNYKGSLIDERAGDGKSSFFVRLKNIFKRSPHQETNSAVASDLAEKWPGSDISQKRSSLPSEAAINFRKPEVSVEGNFPKTNNSAFSGLRNPIVADRHETKPTPAVGIRNPFLSDNKVSSTDSAWPKNNFNKESVLFVPPAEKTETNSNQEKEGFFPQKVSSSTTPETSQTKKFEASGTNLPVQGFPVGQRFAQNPVAKPVGGESGWSLPQSGNKGIDLPDVSLSPEKIMILPRLVKSRVVTVLIWFLFFTIILTVCWWWNNDQLAILVKNTKIFQGKILAVEKEIAPLIEVKERTLSIERKFSRAQNVFNKHIYWTKFFSLLEKYTSANVSYNGLAANTSGVIHLNASTVDLPTLGGQILLLKTASDFVSKVDVSNIIVKTGQEVTFSLDLVLNQNLFYANR